MLIASFTIGTACSEEGNNRTFWSDMAYKIAYPVLESGSRGELKSSMPIEQHKGADRASFAQLEAVGRLLCGIAPWIESGVTNGKEGRQLKEITQMAIQTIKHGVDPNSKDYFNIAIGSQPLVDAAFLAQAFIRSPKVLWGGLDETTKQQVVELFLATRRVKPNYSNWLLFSAMIEAFFIEFGYAADLMRIDYAIKAHHQWYKGDGAYGDGPTFHWDYYNSFVIQPMMVDISTILFNNKLMDEREYHLIHNRSTRYAAVLERLISPEGTYPPIGRSLMYRFGAFQTLGQMALLKKLPKEVTPAQVRSAMSAVIERQMLAKNTFKDGWLTMGFCGSQIDAGESYTCTGSAYLCAVGLLPLGLDPTDEFWSGKPEKWTQVKAWSGESFPIDHSIGY